MKERKPFLLRIDPGLWAELETWAQAELRKELGGKFAEAPEDLRAARADILGRRRGRPGPPDRDARWETAHPNRERRR